MTINWKIRSQVFFKKIFEYFLQGLLYIAPLGLTLFVGYKVWDFLNGLTQVYIDKLIGFKILCKDLTFIFKNIK